MRRLAALAVTFGLTVTAFDAAEVVGPAQVSLAASGAAASRAVPSRSAGQNGGSLAARRLGPQPGKIIRYGGYVIDVPASWPVFRLDLDPAQCVRYDINAVYLGQPGADQQCPAHLAGRVDTISLQASAGPAAMGPAVPAAGWWPATGALALSGNLRRARQVLQDAVDHQVKAEVSAPGLTVSATYAGDPALVSQIIGSVRRAQGATARPGGAAQPSAGTPGGTSGTGGAGTSPTAPASQPGGASTPAGTSRPAASSQPAGSGGPGATGHAAATKSVSMTQLAGTGQAAGTSLARSHRRRVRRGFDTCATPSLRAMRKFRRAFSVAAVYLGGAEAACGNQNLTRGWVRRVTRMGWGLLPTFVGRQAPCNRRFRVRIHVGHANGEGRAAARHAIRLARARGIGRGAPVYYDMEAYHSRRSTCRKQVLSFFNGWTRQLRRQGYRPGIYSSAGSGAASVVRATRVYHYRLARPASLWFALWNGRANLRGGPYLPHGWWQAPGRRIKQYRGGHRVRIGGVTLNIDSDLVNGATYR